MKLKERLNAKLKKQGGFTLIEMLIVVAIIAILVFVSIPMMKNSLDKVKKATDDANARAAKAEAAVEWLVDETMMDEGGASALTVTRYYDANSGALVKTKAEVTVAYGQWKTQKDQIIEVTITKENGKIDCKWVAQ